MDPRVAAIVTEQLGAGLPGLAGTEARMAIRLSDQLVNQLIAASLPGGGAVRSVTVQARAGNALDVTIVLARPAFLPPLHAQLAIERQPVLPADPVLALRLTGGAGSLLKLAGPWLGGALPAGVRLDHDLVLVDVRALLASRGQASHLHYARELQVTTEASAIVVNVVAGVS
jgi:hypothetical protein